MSKKNSNGGLGKILEAWVGDPTALGKLLRNTVRSYSANKAGFPVEGEIPEPTGILSSALVTMALGPNVVRSPCGSSKTGIRYTLGDGIAIVAIIMQMASGFGAFSPSQADTEQPAFGVHESMWDAEMEAVNRVLHERDEETD